MKEMQEDKRENNDEFENMQEESLSNAFDDSIEIEQTKSKVKKKDNTLKDISDMVLYFGTVILVVLLIYHFVGQQVEVNGSSMETTLSNEDRLILEKITYRFAAPERFDIIVFRPYKEEKNLFFIKRIIGLPGETVQIVGNDIYINGEILDENYGNEPMEDPGVAEEPITLGDDEYFVLGDNRNHSTDSRYEIGNVSKDAIIGRTFARIWPLNEMKILKHQ